MYITMDLACSSVQWGATGHPMPSSSSPVPSPAVIATRVGQYQSMFWWFLLVIVVAGIIVAYLYNLSRSVVRRKKMAGG
jgi:hypothetical protein